MTAHASSTPNVFDAFYANQTPANAVALAIADHQASSGRPASEFTDALRKAEAQCNAHEGLVFALRQIAVYVGVNEMTVAPARPVAPYEMQKIARTALARVGI